jgi:hypothetical protein
MGKRLLVGLLAALVLSAGSLHAQDSGGDDSGSSDTGPSSGPGDSGPSAGPGDTGPSDNSGPSDNTGPDDNSDPDPTDPANNAFTDPTDQNSMNTLDFAAQQAHDAITTPWGGVPGPVTFGNANQLGPNGNPVPGGFGNPGPIPAPPTTGAPSLQRAQIHAVIVSNPSDPSQVLSGNVDLTGGIIALGPPTGSLKPGRWDPRVRIIPDPDLLNGSKIPPLVPNVIDVRITHYEVTRTIESQGSVSDHP